MSAWRVGKRNVVGKRDRAPSAVRGLCRAGWAVADYCTYEVGACRIGGDSDEPPGRSGRGVWCRVAAGFDGHDGVVRLCVGGAGGAAQRGQLGDDLSELIWVFEVDRDEPLIAGGPTQRRGIAVEATDPHRDSRSTSFVTLDFMPRGANIRASTKSSQAWPETASTTCPATAYSTLS